MLWLGVNLVFLLYLTWPTTNMSKGGASESIEVEDVALKLKHAKAALPPLQWNWNSTNPWPLEFHLIWLSRAFVVGRLESQLGGP